MFAKAQGDRWGELELETYVNSPELLNRVEGDNLLQQVIPVVTLETIPVSVYDVEIGLLHIRSRGTDLAAGGLGEPQGPLVLKRVLDIEVILIVKDGNVLAVIGVGGIKAGLPLSGDGDGGKVDLLRHGECDVGEVGGWIG